MIAAPYTRLADAALKAKLKINGQIAWFLPQNLCARPTLA
jgi:hypothetical protein